MDRCDDLINNESPLIPDVSESLALHVKRSFSDWTEKILTKTHFQHTFPATISRIYFSSSCNKQTNVSYLPQRNNSPLKSILLIIDKQTYRDLPHVVLSNRISYRSANKFRNFFSCFHNCNVGARFLKNCSDLKTWFCCEIDVFLMELSRDKGLGGAMKKLFFT